MLLMNTVTLVFVLPKRCSIYMKSISSFYKQKLIMHMECGRAIFGKHSKFSMICCRKCNFMLIDVEVRRLLAFLASIKDKVHVYVSVFGCLHIKSLRFSKICFQGLHLGLWIQQSLL